MSPKPLSHAQIGQLGGFTTARKAGTDGSESMADRGAKGGQATASKLGREHYVRMAHRRHGRNVGMVSHD